MAQDQSKSFPSRNPDRQHAGIADFYSQSSSMKFVFAQEGHDFPADMIENWGF
jgi:hypothetical protein